MVLQLNAEDGDTDINAAIEFSLQGKVVIRKLLNREIRRILKFLIPKISGIWEFKMNFQEKQEFSEKIVDGEREFSGKSGEKYLSPKPRSERGFLEKTGENTVC